MGRVFVIELEGAVYTCKKCHTHLALPSDIISKVIDVFSHLHLIFNLTLHFDMPLMFSFQNGRHEYEFSKLFNTFLAERTVKEIFCVVCSNEIGIYGVTDPNTYWVMRAELHGPEGSDDEV
ncbi:protein yippee-like At3g08990 [Brassica rapa]|uniref:protein yippee-like At3g08990 n=1 Tax=Brassica campestris TaxID=3711 RepID=UPI00142DFB4E|nr:protein yippee-like At3g08990 [Brassica rapa]